MLRAHGQEAHVGAEISVGGDDEEVNVLHLGLSSLLKKGSVQHVHVRVQPCKEDQGHSKVNRKGHKELFCHSVSNSSVLGARSILVRRLVSVGVSHFVDVHNV